MADIVTQVEEKIKSDLTWLQKHERLIIVTFVLLVALVLGNKWINGRADKAEARAAVAEQIAKEKTEIVNQLEKQNEQQAQDTAQVKLQYQQIVDTLEKQNQALTNAINVRNTQLAQQQHIDQTAPLTDVAQRVKTLANLQEGDISVSGSNTTVTESGTRQIASELERVPVLQSNLNDIQVIADNRQKELDKSNELVNSQGALISGLGNQIGALNVKIQADGDACKAEIKKVKAGEAKAKRNWFIGGVLTATAFFARMML